MPRYQMLIQELLKFTWKTHVDYEPLTEALQHMISTANYINDKIKDYDKNQRLIEIRESIIGMKKDYIMDAHNRFMVKEGSLYQYNANKWKQHYFFLFNDRIIRTKIMPDNQYYFLDKIPLIKVKAKKVKLNGPDKNSTAPECMLSIVYSL